jgi:hypothetical protein
VNVERSHPANRAGQSHQDVGRSGLRSVNKYLQRFAFGNSAFDEGTQGSGLGLQDQWQMTITQCNS